MKTLRVFSANRCHVKQESLARHGASQSLASRPYAGKECVEPVCRTYGRGDAGRLFLCPFLRGFEQSDKQRMWSHGSRQKLRVELTRHHIRMVCKLHDLDQISIRG